MSAILFQKSGMSDLTLANGVILPKKHTYQINQKRYFTESMNAVVLSLSSKAELLILRIADVSKDNFNGSVNGLKTWFDNSLINYSENNFTLVDENGETSTVRLWADNFEIDETQPGLFSLELTLLKEA